jgi:hypothetical protein
MPEYGFYGFPMGGRLMASGLLTGLTAYWKMDETSGTRLDSVGSNHLTDNNSVSSAAGKIGTASSHTAASSQYLTVGGSLTASGSARTVSLCVYPTDVSTQRAFASFAAAATPLSGTPVFILGYRQGGGSGPFFAYSGGNYRNGTTVAALNTWYHVAYTYDPSSSNVGLWINGTREVNVTAADSNSGTTLYIGAGFNAYHDGRVDEVGLWSRVLTSIEIGTLYNAGVGVTYPLFG